MERKVLDEKSETGQLSSYIDFLESNKLKEKSLLESVCKQNAVNVEAVNRLINLEISMKGKMRRRGLQNQIDAIIQSEIMSKEEEV